MRCVIPAQDLNQRLNGTICRYDGKPVHVRYHSGNKLELHTLSTGKHIDVINSDDPLLDISGIPLGFVQVTPSVVVYVSRRPSRIYKQGVTSDVLSTKFLGQSRENPFVKFSVTSKAFEDMILNKYPSLEDALKLTKMKESPESNFTEIAISRDVALKYNHKMQITTVYFKGDEIGFIIKDSRTVITPSDEKGWIVSKHLSYFDWKVE